MEKNSKKFFIPKRLHNMNQSNDLFDPMTFKDLDDLDPPETTASDDEELAMMCQMSNITMDLEEYTLEVSDDEVSDDEISDDEMEVEGAAQTLLLLSKPSLAPE